MRFSDPYWLLAGGLTGVALVVMWHRYDVWQRAALTRFIAAHLRLKLTGSVSAVGRFMQRGLFLGAVLLLFVALAGPQIGYHWEQISRRGNEVVFALDTSRSMLTPDVKPNRLTRAKLAIDDMARQLEGDGIGIVAFAGSAFLVCPLTLDYGAFHQSLDVVDVHTIPQGGTNIASAILAARAAFRRRPGSDRILILVTDGENLEGDAQAAAAEAAKQEGLKIFTVGIGTAEGELIPLPAELGGGFVKDEKGDLVKSHLDEGGLKAIAAATGGAYVHLEGQGENFEAFLRTVFSAVARHDLIYRQQKIYNERYQWPLAASLVMLLGSLVVGTRRLGRRRTVTVAPSRAAVVSAVLLGLVTLPNRSESADPATPGSDGKASAKTPVVEYNRGTAAYRAGQFSQASKAFQQSIRSAPASDAQRLADQEDAYYNLGNALYRAGEQVEKSDPQAAIKQWTDAVKAYDTALQLRGGDGDSRFNRDFVQRRIDALREPPPEGGGGGGGADGGGKGGGDGKGQGQSGGGGQGQPPPQGQGQPPGQPPPQGQPAQSPAGRQAGPPPSGAAPPAEAGAQTVPGQMSPEEARELLDSAKSEEHNSLLVPTGPRDPNQPEKPIKNW